MRLHVRCGKCKKVVSPPLFWTGSGKAGGSVCRSCRDLRRSPAQEDYDALF